VEFDVKFPEPGTLSAESKAALLQHLPAPEKQQQMEMEGATGEVEEVHLVDVNLEEEKARQQESAQSREAYEEDEERGHRHGGQPGCRAQ